MRFKTRLKIDLGCLKRNVARLRELAPDNQILFMVKANAYGHGMVPIVRFAISELGLKEFGCATLGEALTLRRELGDLKFEVYVFSDLEINSEQGRGHYLENRIIPVLSSVETLREFLQDEDCEHLPLCLKFDTGMNRLGILTQEVPETLQLLQRYGRKTIHHLMSHFSCSSQPVKKNKRTQKQYDEFLEIKRAFAQQGLTLEKSSMANSGAIEQGFALQESHIRPGLMLYGPSSLVGPLREKGPWKGENISSLETHIIQIKQIKKGDPVGYGALPAPASGIIAYMALGYGDGLTNFYRGIRIHCQGYEGQVIGRISMDMAAVLFPPEAQKGLRLGDPILIWNQDSESVYRISDHIGSIPYEVFCGLSERIPRIYSLS